MANPTTRQLLAALDAKAVSVAVDATRPSLSTDGVDVTGWLYGNFFSSQMAVVQMVGTATSNVASPTGGTNGVEIWGYRDAQWFRIGYLNDGSAIDIDSAAQGYATEVDIIGIFERIAIAGTPSAGTVTATLVPIEIWQ